MPKRIRLMPRRTTEIPLELEERIKRVLKTFNKRWTAWSREALRLHLEKYEKNIVEEEKCQ